MENYKNIPDFGLYAISDLGNIKNVKTGRILKPSVVAGYYSVSLYPGKKSFHIHKLVAAAFLGHNKTGREFHVNHINFDRLDNRLVNLEVIPARENLNRKHIDSSSEYTGVAWKKKNSKWQSKIVINGSHFYLGLYKSEIRAKIAYDLALFQEDRIKELILN